jgi:hypothetical protein
MMDDEYSKEDNCGYEHVRPWHPSRIFKANCRNMYEEGIW